MYGYTLTHGKLKCLLNIFCCVRCHWTIYASINAYSNKPLVIIHSYDIIFRLNSIRKKIVTDEWFTFKSSDILQYYFEYNNLFVPMHREFPIVSDVLCRLKCMTFWLKTINKT